MIVLPRRSITRFFVPLIDVLILLFCIFLLMPFVTPPDNPTVNPMPNEASNQPEIADLQRRLREAERRVERMIQQNAQVESRLAVKILEIDADNGRLYNFDPQAIVARQEVVDANDAQRLIDEQKRRYPGKESYFLILYPRKLTGYPLARQMETYRRWFQNVPIGFDNPWDGASR
jgi:hypothetical protein